MINRKTAGNDLLKFRNDHKLTQVQLAEKTDVSVQTISAIEGGDLTPQSMTIYKLNQYVIRKSLNK